MVDAVLELNASNERGIEVVRNRIKMFAQQKVTLPHGRHKVSSKALIVIETPPRLNIFQETVSVCFVINF